MYNESKKKIILVSNGEPYSHEWDEDDIKCKKLAGGLTTGLDPMMQEEKGVWIAWGRGDADFEVVDEQNKVRVPDENGYTLKRVKLTPREENGFYYGFSNETLWPISHSFIDKAIFNRHYWKTYYEVNKKFARATLEEIQNDNPVWVHDYHLTLLPGFIKEEKPATPVGFFWHIPWPAWESFRTIPWQQEIIEHMLASDFIAFHTPHLVRNFLTCAEKNGAEIDQEKKIITYKNHQTKVTAVPLGVDYKTLSSRASQSEMGEKALEIKKAYHAEHLIFAVDRLDYTKGILQRLQAIERFFEKYPECIGKVTLVQRLSPSRTKVDEYQEMRDEINQKIGSINGRFQRDLWAPVRSFHQSVPQEELLPYFRAADIALITPLIDGMNLVAKEYIAAQDEGMLILSRFAGASTALKEAIQVNPYDIEEVVEAIHQALKMPAEEKQRKMKIMKDEVKNRDINWWREEYLKRWLNTGEEK